MEDYFGTNPMPQDFELFWETRMNEAEQVPLSFTLSPAGFPEYETVGFYELWFTGINGEKVYAKYLKPKTQAHIPLVLQFHGYPGASRSWLEQCSFCGMGFALVAMDCPGQGGFGQDVGGYMGSTVSGHLIAGLDGDPKDMYYVRLYQNIRILCRIVKQLEGINLNRVYINGASQGGGLGLGCAALNSDLIAKAAILYPFLSDFQKVFELDADVVAYEGLRYYSRWFDPEGTRLTETFTKLGYFDTQNFAHMVRCQVLFGTGLSDTICPPITQDAVYNKLNCKKRREFFPGFGHEEIQAFDDMLLSFFQEVPIACETLSFGDHLTARYLYPSGDGMIPTVLMFHDSGRPVRGWHHMSRFIALGYAVLALEEQSSTAIPALIDLALGLPRTGKLITWGEGFGGSLAIEAAAQFPKVVNGCAALNPFFTDASTLQCPFLLGTGMMGTLSPSANQKALFETAGCLKKHLTYPKYGHERIKAFEDAMLRFFA